MNGEDEFFDFLDDLHFLNEMEKPKPKVQKDEGCCSSLIWLVLGICLLAFILG